MIAGGSLLYIRAKPVFAIRPNTNMCIGVIPYVGRVVGKNRKIGIFSYEIA
jgi:hypothetical protein